jgi:hypothetical protein
MTFLVAVIFIIPVALHLLNTVFIKPFRHRHH